MCGIAAVWSEVRPPHELMRIVSAMALALKHRGPDDDGIRVLNARNSAAVGLGHTRLSILDLSEAGHRPMTDERTGTWIVYNGEIYNFKELRATLESRGVVFHTHTDTEVILKGFVELGTEFIPLLNGIFAFTIWDPVRQVLILARDHLGVKPLYYHRAPREFLVASEVRALLATGVVPRELSDEGVESFLALGAVQEPASIIRSVFAFPPGSIGIWDGTRLDIREYWSLDKKPTSRSTNYAEARAYLDDLLPKVVSSQLTSDVPVCTFLSGGIDSTALVSLTRRLTDAPPRTLSITFLESSFSEMVSMRQAAARYGANHTEVTMTSDAVISRIPQAIAAMDQPSFDGINTFVVSEQARRAGLSVALSGLGGDELFGGYDTTFRGVPWLEAINRVVPKPMRRLAATVPFHFWPRERANKVARWLNNENLEGDAYALVRELFQPSSRAKLMPDIARVKGPSRPTMSGDAFTRVTKQELATYTRNVLLRDADAMGMAHGLEIRVPLLDVRIVDYMLSLAAEEKTRGRRTKALLCDAVGDLPRTVTSRPKQGFALPFQLWLRSSMRSEVEACLLADDSAEALRLDNREVLRIWNTYLHENGSWTRPWALYVLRSWCRQNLDKN